jgi:nucleoside-diphosphate-sugar epimerase
LLQFTFGDRNSLVDWLHVDNLIQSLVLAAKALDRPDCPAGGKAYFVNDGEPANNFDFLMPIVQGLGYR